MSTLSRSRGATRADVLAALGLLALGAVCVPGALRAQEDRLDRANRTKCANNLRQLGLAAIQYADDKRFFPHLGPIRELDGGYRTNAATRVVRTLVYLGYHDNPEGFVCPSTQDEWLPVPEAARTNMRLWGWGGRPSKDGAPLPLVAGEDPTLAETTELSYGWTRRGMNSNVRSMALLGADRMKDNHGDAGNVLQADCTVNVRPATVYDGPLAATEGADAGYLSVRGKDDPAPTRTVAGPPPAWAGSYSDGAVTLTLAATPTGWSGDLTVSGARYRVRGAPVEGGTFKGKFESEGDVYDLSARLEGTTLVLTSGRRTYRLARR